MIYNTQKYVCNSCGSTKEVRIPISYYRFPDVLVCGVKGRKDLSHPYRYLKKEVDHGVNETPERPPGSTPEGR